MKRTPGIDRMAQSLLERRDELRRLLAVELGSLTNEFEARGVADDVDAASDTVRAEVCSQLAQHESEELDQIDAALGRIEDRTYGRCHDCAQPIPTARLQALPYSKSCIDCQRRNEGQALSKAQSGSAWTKIESLHMRSGNKQVDAASVR